MCFGAFIRLDFYLNPIMYLVKTPEIIKPLGKDFLWNFDRGEKNLYITFDDGPTPQITEETLDLLKEFNARATFFCLGKNVEENQLLYARILQEGHQVGNHSTTHPDGWKTCTFGYVKDVLKAQQKIQSNLFRPPYGHITFSQASLLKKKFKIVMWDVISGDFDPTVTEESCFQNVRKAALNGSIIVFHDNAKVGRKMLPALRKTLQYFSEAGYSFLSIPETGASSQG